MLRRTFPSERDQVTGSGSKEYNEEMHICYAYLMPDVVTMMRASTMMLVRYAARIGAKRISFGVLVRKYEGKRSKKTSTLMRRNKLGACIFDSSCLG
jgi:hypothetical protein